MKNQRLLALALVAVTALMIFPTADAQDNQTITVTPKSGPAGTIVDVEALGFNSFFVDVFFGAKKVSEAVFAGANPLRHIGSFAVPDVPPGEYTVEANTKGYASTTFTVTARVPKVYDTAWQQKLGNEMTQSTSNLVQTDDGGFAYIDRGWSYQFSFIPSTLYKVNATGGVERKKSLGLFRGGDLVATSDGEFAILGDWSTYGTTYQNTPTLVKTDLQGNIQCVMNYTKSIGDHFLLTNDGGYVFLKRSSNLFDPPTNPSQENYTSTLTRTNSRGEIQWIKNFSEPAFYNTLDFIAKTSDQGFVMVGTSSYNGSSDTPNLYLWIVKVDNRGNLQWRHLYGDGPPYVIANQTENAGAYMGINRWTKGHTTGVSIAQTSDGGFVASGIVYENRYVPRTLLVKVDSTGNLRWNKTYDGAATSPIIEASDHGIIFANSKGIMKLNAYGILEWIKDDVTYPSAGIRSYILDVTSLIETSDGALAGIGVGSTSSTRRGGIYLFKTQLFLPPPTPSPPPLPTDSDGNFWQSSPFFDFAVLGVVFVVVIAVLVTVFLRRSKRNAGFFVT